MQVKRLAAAGILSALLWACGGAPEASRPAQPLKPEEITALRQALGAVAVQAATTVATTVVLPPVTGGGNPLAVPQDPVPGHPNR